MAEGVHALQQRRGFGDRSHRDRFDDNAIRILGPQRQLQNIRCGLCGRANSDSYDTGLKSGGISFHHCSFAQTSQVDESAAIREQIHANASWYATAVAAVGNFLQSTKGGIGFSEGRIRSPVDGYGVILAKRWSDDQCLRSSGRVEKYDIDVGKVDAAKRVGYRIPACRLGSSCQGDGEDEEDAKSEVVEFGGHGDYQKRYG